MHKKGNYSSIITIETWNFLGVLEVLISFRHIQTLANGVNSCSSIQERSFIVKYKKIYFWLNMIQMIQISRLVWSDRIAWVDSP